MSWIFCRTSTYKSTLFFPPAPLYSIVVKAGIYFTALGGPPVQPGEATLLVSDTMFLSCCPQANVDRSLCPGTWKGDCDRGCWCWTHSPGPHHFTAASPDVPTAVLAFICLRAFCGGQFSLSTCPAGLSAGELPSLPSPLSCPR